VLEWTQRGARRLLVRGGGGSDGAGNAVANLELLFGVGPLLYWLREAILRKPPSSLQVATLEILFGDPAITKTHVRWLARGATTAADVATGGNDGAPRRRGAVARVVAASFDALSLRHGLRRDDRLARIGGAPLPPSTTLDDARTALEEVSADVTHKDLDALLLRITVIYTL
jgi:hypothetical protein